MRLISLDPGETTGVCIYLPEKREFILRQETTITGEDFVQFYDLLESWYDKWTLQYDFKVIVEQFNFRMNERERTKINYTPREVIGVTKLWAAQHDVPIEMQMAAEGKAFWNDDKLSRIGLNKSGQPHARDALRHMLQYITFTMKDNHFLMQLKPDSLRTY